MRGKPKFKVCDKVRFTLQNEEFEGVIYHVDAYGVLEQDDVSYDILVDTDSENMMCKLYKYIQEKYVSELKTK